MDEVLRAYATQAPALVEVLGTEVSATDPDRSVVENWARTVPGAILDVGSGTGRWSGHLARLGHSIEGLEPVEEFVEIARKAHPPVSFRQGSIADLAGSDERWSGVLAWYSLIHLTPESLLDALTTLHDVLEKDGTILLSFFSGPRLEAFRHPATTAYRWPMDQMIVVLARAGFTVQSQFWDPHAPHASIVATR